MNRAPKPEAIAQPTPTGEQKPPHVFPITFINSKDVLPRKYIVHLHSQLCRNCGTLHEWSQTYAFNEMLSRTGAGKLVIHLVPVSELSYNLPVQTYPLERKSVPVCHACAATASLSHLPDPRGTDEWNRIYAVAQAPELPKFNRSGGGANSPKKAKSAPKTIDDLLF